MQSVAKICFILVLLGICHTNGRRLNGKVDEPMVLPFVCNSTNASSITIYTGASFNYIIYDVAQKKCTNYSNYYKHRIESCVLNGKNFNLSFGQLNWNDKGNYTAWDDQGFFLDSIVVDIQDNNKSTQQVTYFLHSTTPKEGNGNAFAWPLGSSIVVILVATCLAIIVVMKYRQRKAQKTTTNKLEDRNESQDTTNSSHNECPIYEEATSPAESIMILTTINNEHDLTDVSHNRGQDKVKQNAKQIYALELNSAQSPKRTKSKLLKQSNLSSAETIQSETDHVYNNSHRCIHLQTECLLDEPYPSSSETTVGSSCKYENLVRRNYRTAQALVPDPHLTDANKGQVMIADSTLCHNKVHNQSSSLVDPSTLYAKVNKMKNKRSHCKERNETC